MISSFEASLKHLQDLKSPVKHNGFTSNAFSDGFEMVPINLTALDKTSLYMGDKKIYMNIRKRTYKDGVHPKAKKKPSNNKNKRGKANKPRSVAPDQESDSDQPVAKHNKNNGRAKPSKTTGNRRNHWTKNRPAVGEQGSDSEQLTQRPSAKKIIDIDGIANMKVLPVDDQGKPIQLVYIDSQSEDESSDDYEDAAHNTRAKSNANRYGMDSKMSSQESESDTSSRRSYIASDSISKTSDDDMEIPDSRKGNRNMASSKFLSATTQANKRRADEAFERSPIRKEIQKKKKEKPRLGKSLRDILKEKSILLQDEPIEKKARTRQDKDAALIDSLLSDQVSDTDLPSPKRNFRTPSPVKLSVSSLKGKLNKDSDTVPVKTPKNKAPAPRWSKPGRNTSPIKYGSADSKIGGAKSIHNTAQEAKPSTKPRPQKLASNNISNRDTNGIKVNKPISSSVLHDTSNSVSVKNTISDKSVLKNGVEKLTSPSQGDLHDSQRLTKPSNGYSQKIKQSPQTESSSSVSILLKDNPDLLVQAYEIYKDTIIDLIEVQKCATNRNGHRGDDYFAKLNSFTKKMDRAKKMVEMEKHRLSE
ncbi:hypothetical protein DASC09_029470 [Saccharomycopsis crataegensis]|uniref:Uncharacterized protein n=1 Tax=Saccharomycopsis crataegensis TaxID=43959 RepID=A0AAV5QLG7_9ASCO|nr:hypothetical protein DASC09_029470 [Saccharomycopsis crataegensis]